jgi:hypothetical protein
MQFTLVAQGPHHLRYLADVGAEAATTGTIQLSGAGDADVALEDAVVAGPLKQIISAQVNNAAEARRLVMDDGLGSGDPDITDGLGRAVTTVVGRAGTRVWQCDANDDAGAIEINVVADGDSCQAYVEILFRHSYTQR